MHPSNSKSELLLNSISTKENNEPSTPTSIKRKQVLINEKNTSILQLWDQKLRLSNDRMEAYALNEMANVERLHKIDEQINLAVDQIGQTFKERIQTILIDNQLSITQVPHTLAPSTLFKDGQQMTSDAFFDEMNKRYFTDDKSFEKYAETLELFRSTYLILKKNNDELRRQLKNVDQNNEFVQMQKKLEETLVERDSYVSLYQMSKIRAEKAEEKLRQSAEQQNSLVELLVEKFGFVDRLVDNRTIIARDLFKPDTNIEIFNNFNVQLSTGEHGFIETAKSCPPGKFKISFPHGLTAETREILLNQTDETIEPVRVILKFRKYLFQSEENLSLS